MNVRREIERPRQAVILAGGLGTRLRPLTNSLPKPMIPVNGRPFMTYLVDQLRENGFERILMLLGYQADKITEYFGDGTEFGLNIQYSILDSESETGRRVKMAEYIIDEYFFLMYCDNYWPLDFEIMWDYYINNTWITQVGIYRNRDRFTRDNMRVGSDGRVEVYDKTRTATGLSGVDVWFVISSRKALSLLPDDNVSFEATVYPALILQGNLGAYQSDDRYYSIGSLERVEETARHLAQLRNSS